MACCVAPWLNILTAPLQPETRSNEPIATPVILACLLPVEP